MSQKQQFFDLMDRYMEANPNLYLIFVGLGYPRYDDFKAKYGDRAINTEASEQTALDMAVGLAYAGKIPVVYTITPFLLRGFETIRTYINHEKLPIIMVGAGRDDEYSKDDGFSHDARDIKAIMNTMENIKQSYPEDEEELTIDLGKSLTYGIPCFLSLRR